MNVVAKSPARGAAAWAIMAIVGLVCSCGRGHTSDSPVAKDTPGSPLPTSKAPVAFRSYEQIACNTVAPVQEIAGRDIGFEVAAGKALVDSCALSMAARLFMVSDPDTIVARLNRCMYNDMAMSFTGARDDILADHPFTAAARHTGSCLGIGMLYLILAERLELPLYGVVVPRHFYVRFDNGARVIGIEALKEGEHRDDSWYRSRFGIGDSSWYTLGNLTREQCAAVLWFNIGNAFQAAGNHGEASGAYLRTVDLFPSYAEAWGNLGIAWNDLGKEGPALDAFNRAREADPGIRNLSRNLAALFVRNGDYKQAIAEYKRALAGEPSDPEILYGLAYSWFMRGDYHEAVELGRRALEHRSDFDMARQLVMRAETLTRENRGNRQNGG